MEINNIILINMKKLLQKLNELAYEIFTANWPNYLFIAGITIMSAWLAFIIYQIITI